MSMVRSATPGASPAEHKLRRRMGLRVIALYKLAKTIGLILVAIAAFRLERAYLVRVALQSHQSPPND